MTRRQGYSGPRDLRRMQELVQRLWHRDLLEEVLDWFEGAADGRDPSCMVMEGDQCLLRLGDAG